MWTESLLYDSTRRQADGFTWCAVLDRGAIRNVPSEAAMPPVAISSRSLGVARHEQLGQNGEINTQ